MTIEEIMSRRLGDRRFLSCELPAESVEKILRAALLTAYGEEENTVELFVTDDARLTERLADARDCGSECVLGAPLVVVVAADRLYDGAWVEHCSAAVWAMCAQAAEAGLAYCPVQIRGYRLTDGTMSDEVVRGTLGIPDSKTVYAVVAFGKTAAESNAVAADSEMLDWQRVHVAGGTEG